MKSKNKDVISQITELQNNSKSDLRGQKLTSLDLQDKDFSNSDLSETNFMMSNLVGCDLTNCNLTGTNLLNANLAKVIFEGAKRNGKQILKHAAIINGMSSGYGFLCADGDRKIIYINEGNKPEVEFKMSSATDMGRMLYQLLMNG